MCRRSGAVEGFLNDGWDGLDLGAQLLLDAEEVEAVLVGDQVDGQAEVAKAAGAPDAVQVRLGVLGEVKVDDHVHRLDVDSAREQICRPDTAPFTSQNTHDLRCMS